MKRILIPALIGLCVASLGFAQFSTTSATHDGGERIEASQDKKKKKKANPAAKKPATPATKKAASPEAKKPANQEVEQLTALVQQIRAELEGLRKQAEDPAKADGGEHAEAGREESVERLRKDQKWDTTRKGVHLVLDYDSISQSFKGTLENKAKKALAGVRVAVHLSNGAVLGPTKPIELKPGQKIPVELPAGKQEFDWWTIQPEQSAAGKDAMPPTDPALRPLYKQLQLLKREVEQLSKNLSAVKR